MNKQRVFIDMDGVLCSLKSDIKPEEMLVEGFFRNLAPRHKMLKAVVKLIKSGKVDVYILSAVIPEIECEAKADKNAWLNEFLPEIDEKHRIFTLCGADKADAVNGVRSDDILFDDYSNNLKLWQAAGGKAVKILNEFNGKNGTFNTGIRLEVSNSKDLINAVKTA